MDRPTSYSQAKDNQDIPVIPTNSILFQGGMEPSRPQHLSFFTTAPALYSCFPPEFASELNSPMLGTTVSNHNGWNMNLAAITTESVQGSQHCSRFVTNNSTGLTCYPASGPSNLFPQDGTDLNMDLSLTLNAGLHSNFPSGNLVCQKRTERRVQFPDSTNPPQFQCKWNGCDPPRYFTREGDLIRHLKTIHVSPDAFICRVDNCGRPFGRKDHLRQHQQRCHKLG